MLNSVLVLHLALNALGITQGDFDFAAMINAVLLVGTTPVIVDIKECFSTSHRICYCDRDKAIIPVHLYEQVCDMEAIMNLSNK